MKKYAEPFDEMVTRKRIARMSKIDSLPHELRELVHEYGFYIVDNFVRNGVTKPKRIRHLVELVLDEFSPTRGTASSQGVQTKFEQHLKVPE